MSKKTLIDILAYQDTGDLSSPAKLLASGPVDLSPFRFPDDGKQTHKNGVDKRLFCLCLLYAGDDFFENPGSEVSLHIPHAEVVSFVYPEDDDVSDYKQSELVTGYKNLYDVCVETPEGRFDVISEVSDPDKSADFFDVRIAVPGDFDWSPYLSAPEADSGQGQ